MGATHFTADLHLNHGHVAGIRGFESSVDHDDAIEEAWTSAVRPEDTVYILGDLCVGGRAKVDAALERIDSWPGTKHLLAGNHDPVASIHRDGWKHQRRYLEVFASVRDFARIRRADRDVLLSHYPYSEHGDGPEREGSRYEQYRLPDMGLHLIHGHTHQGDPFALDRRLMCVSWDAWGRLVSDRDVELWLRGGDA